MALYVNGKKVAGIGLPGKSAYQYAVDGGYTGTRVFVLKENETNVWTFLIPETTIDFDRIPMENNERDSREPLNENDNN